MTEVCGIFNTTHVYVNVQNYELRAAARQPACLKMTRTEKPLSGKVRGGRASSNKCPRWILEICCIREKSNNMHNLNCLGAVESTGRV